MIFLSAIFLHTKTYFMVNFQRINYTQTAVVMKYARSLFVKKNTLEKNNLKHKEIATETTYLPKNELLSGSQLWFHREN